MNRLCLILSQLLISITYVTANDSYPQEALQCYASSALKSQKDGVIICPADRQNYCIKEVVNATSRGDCGTVPGIYYGRDVWDRKVSKCLSSDASSWSNMPTFITYFILLFSLFQSLPNASTENVQQLVLRPKMTESEYLEERKSH